MSSTPPPPGFGPSMMDQLQQPGTPGQAPPQNGKGPRSAGNDGAQGPRRGPGGSQTLGMPPPQVPQQLPPQMFTTAAQLLDLTDSEYILLLGETQHKMSQALELDQAQEAIRYTWRTTY